MNQAQSSDHVRVTGHLGVDAEVLYAPGGKTAVLKLEIEPAKGLPYLVVQNLGEDPSAHIAAKSKARQLLRRGAPEVKRIWGLGYRQIMAENKARRL